jgi:hypothetical protein
MSSSAKSYEIRLWPSKFDFPEVTDFNDETKEEKAREAIISYLKTYGFLAKESRPDDYSLTHSIEKFQRVGNLPVTGYYDEATRDLMGRPRCGWTQDVINDEHTSNGIQVRIEPLSEKFDKTDLTWRIEQFTPDMTPAKVRRAVADAFSCWAAVTPLSFKEVATGGDIVLRIVTEGHDGPRDVLVRGFALGGVNFDEAEDLLHSFSLAAVALHEVGHVLGLSHSIVENATMWPWYGGAYWELHPDDIHGIHSKYGRREPQWIQITKANHPTNPSLQTKSVLSSSNLLFRLAADGTIWQYNDSSPTSWKQIGDSPGTVQMTCDSRNLYILNKSGEILEWNGEPNDWTTIDHNPDTVQIVTAGGELYLRRYNADNNYAAIYRFMGLTHMPVWELIDEDHSTRQIEVENGGPLYQRHDSGSLWRYVGPGIKWEPVDESAEATMIAAGGGALYYVDRLLGLIRRITTTGTTSTTVALKDAANTRSIVAKGDFLCQLRNDKSLWRFSGKPISGWEQLDVAGATEEVTVNETGDIYQRRGDGSIWRLGV